MLSSDDAQRPASRSIAFPIRLERGLFETVDEREAYLVLLEIMARTPRGSWTGHASFGFNDFFTDVSKDGLTPEQRVRLSDSAVMEINSVLVDLGLTRYRVESLAFEPIENRSASSLDGPRHWNSLSGQRGASLLLRETGTDRAVKCVL